jgi:hypothetical protein
MALILMLLYLLRSQIKAIALSCRLIINTCIRINTFLSRTMQTYLHNLTNISLIINYNKNKQYATKNV